MSPKSPRPKIELDRNLGTDPYQTEERKLRNNYQNTVAEDMDEFGKVGAEISHIQSQMHSEDDSAESISERGLKMENHEKCWLHHWTCIVVEIVNHLECQLYRGNLLQWYRREDQVQSVLKLITREEKASSKIHLKSHERLGNPMQCFHQGATNLETSSRVLFSNTLIRQIWEDLFLKLIKIICPIRQDLT